MLYFNIIHRNCNISIYKIPLWIKYKNHAMFFIFSLLSGIIGCFLLALSAPILFSQGINNFWIICMFIIGIILNITASKLSSIYHKILRQDDKSTDLCDKYILCGLLLSLEFSLFSIAFNYLIVHIIVILLGFICFYAIPVFVEKKSNK